MLQCVPALKLGRLEGTSRAILLHKQQSVLRLHHYAGMSYNADPVKWGMQLYLDQGHSLGAVHLYATLRPRFLNAGKVFLLGRRPLQRYGIEQSNEIGPCF